MRVSRCGSGLSTFKAISLTILPSRSTSTMRRLPLSATIVVPSASRWKACTSTRPLYPSFGLASYFHTTSFFGVISVTVVGAVRTAAYAFYEQSQQRYVELASSDHHELAGFVGNISLRDGKPFLHAHCTLADEAGGTVSGHLLRGTEVFVAEVIITEWTDVSLVRAHDETTGLALW